MGFKVIGNRCWRYAWLAGPHGGADLRPTTRAPGRILLPAPRAPVSPGLHPSWRGAGPLLDPSAWRRTGRPLLDPAASRRTDRQLAGPRLDLGRWTRTDRPLAGLRLDPVTSRRTSRPLAGLRLDPGRWRRMDRARAGVLLLLDLTAPDPLLPGPPDNGQHLAPAC